MKLLRILLFPFSLLYGFITGIRNRLYDWNILHAESFDIPVISVGNLEVGGSGKTPVTEYLIRLLSHRYKIATLSRGYGRKTKGFRLVTLQDTAALAGDEPLQIKYKFPEITVSVAEKRTLGITRLKDKHDLILMDDAYQHRAVKPGLSILLFDYHTFYHWKLLLPTGNYREYFSGKERADLIVITKTPGNLTIAEKQDIKRKISPHKEQKLFFSYISYSKKLQSLNSEKEIHDYEIKNNVDVLLITGIAKPKPLLDRLKQHTGSILHHAYSDHHLFSKKNMLKLAEDFKNIKNDKKIILTTEKDAIRLKDEKFKEIIEDLPIYIWPIEIKFHENNFANFDQEILKYVSTASAIS